MVSAVFQKPPGLRREDYGFVFIHSGMFFIEKSMENAQISKFKLKIDMWILLGVTVLILVAMVFTVLKLIDQSQSHVESVSKVKFKLSDMKLRMQKTEADEMIERDIKRDQYRTEAAYPHWEMTKRAMKMIGSMENLNSLDLSDATLDDGWLRYLEKLPLEKLKMPGSSVSDKGANHLAKISTLQQLWIYDTNVSGKAIAILAPLKKLTLLHINGTKTYDADIEGLTAFPELESLDLGGTFITEKGCATIAKLDRVKSLQLNHVPLTNVALERLKQMKSLVLLRVMGCGIDDAKAQLLSQFPHLAELDISDNEITDKGLHELSKSAGLQFLNLSECRKLTDAGVEKFKKAMPNCQLLLKKNVVPI